MSSIQRLFDIPRHQLAHKPLDVSLAGKANGTWYTYSTQDFIDQADKVSLGLLALGLGPADHIANVSANRPEWNIADIGILQMGGIHVPVYPTIPAREYIYIFNDAKVKAVFVSNQEMLSKIMEVKDEIPTLEHIFSYEPIEGTMSLKDLQDKGKNHNVLILEKIKETIKYEDLATIIYTSGTTGNPKGVMLSHKNIISNVINSSPRLPADSGDKALSFLPLCHSFERVVSYIFMYKSVSIYYAENMETIGDNLKEIKPNVFSTVPRLLEKVYDKIVGKMNEATGMKRKIAFWALDLGSRYELNGKNGWWYEQQLKLANKLVFSKWREALGGNVKGIAVGASALQTRLQRCFWAAQIPVLEGYGLSESSPVICFSDLKGMNVKFGTVGKVIDGVQVKIAGDGEILAKGDNIMMGYKNLPEITAETVQDGWLYTGDIGTLDSEGYLKITDRKKEIFKTSGGKYVAPQPIESKIKESMYVEQAMVVGENQKFPSAFITPTWDALLHWCKENNLDTQNKHALLQDKQVHKLYQDIISQSNKDFGQWEQVKRFELVDKDWTVEGGELTPTMKLKRKVILAKCQNYYEKIYND